MSGQLSSTLTASMESVNVEENCTEVFCDDDTAEAARNERLKSATESGDSVAPAKKLSDSRTRTGATGQSSSKRTEMETENGDSKHGKKDNGDSKRTKMETENGESDSDASEDGEHRPAETPPDDGNDENHDGASGTSEEDNAMAEENSSSTTKKTDPAAQSPVFGSKKRKCVSMDDTQLRRLQKQEQEKREAREALALEASRRQRQRHREETAAGTGESGRKPESQRQYFVKDWEFVQTLGEGAYGEVKLAYCERTQEAVAVKIIDTNGAEKSALDDVRKEVCIHRMLNHKNIIRFWGMRKEGHTQYFFLQYASGGELFDRIEPDVGMPQADAQRYFRQLMDGLEYLHMKGVAHRDIKPENLLLDHRDNLKIADFGLATVFRHQGRSRLLDRLCGSAPYLAPEVMGCRPYRAEPADIWSSGVVLVAMLGGELPWDAAVTTCRYYLNWRECHIEKCPWNKIDNLALCLLRRLLVERPEKRYTMEQIQQNQWFKKDFSADTAHQLSAGPKRRRARGSESDQSPGALRPISSSQPAMTFGVGGCWGDGDGAQSGCGGREEAFDTSSDDGPISFSQPAQTDDLLLSSQLNGNQVNGAPSSQTPMQKLVRRMTRFFCQQSKAQVMEELSRVFDMLEYTWKQSTTHVITVHTLDRRQSQLTMKVMILEMGEHLLLDFRLSKGDGLEFKRQFMRIRELMKAVICKVPPSWPNV